MPNEREIPFGGKKLRNLINEILSYVWEVVGRTALEQVLGTAEAVRAMALRAP